MNENAEPFDQHKICFKQDTLKVYHDFLKNNTVI